ncbi:MAG: uroporphyrinogen-III C-methyltransferase [Burkholderiaceae bacterium]|jgi:uroporphyrin-III C-methyltransferase|nr:uroporphyrinogen-III C-methyltransferase [Burkholderiaceae bacterium]
MSAPPTTTPGRIWLVGAGPGDPDLLTLKAVKAIRSASLILVDELVSADILAAHASPGARIVPVGKRGGRHQSTPQAYIEQLMLDAARAGETVVRLKGGDPFIFGRGGEEAQNLRRAGFEPEIVNGITAGLAAITALGAPLTHRQHAPGVLFITGHPQKSGPAIDWAQIARSAHAQRLTLVIYMGVGTLPHICAGLLQGLPASTPAAAIERATTGQQRHCVTTLGQLLGEARRTRLQSPAVIVIGNVVLGARAAARDC